MVQKAHSHFVQFIFSPHSFNNVFILCQILCPIYFLEYPIPAAAPPHARPSQKASHGDISGTKLGIIDPLVSKRPEKILNKKSKKKQLKTVKNGQNGQNGLKLSKMVPNGPKWSQSVQNGEKWSKWRKMVKIVKMYQNCHKW